MKTEKNIFIAFILNLAFAIFEFFGGLFTGSVAILSDAVHDLGDAASIGLSYFLERKSRNQPDEIHTYGYLRYSVLGGGITTLVLLLGSVLVIRKAVTRIIAPGEIHYEGMILFALAGCGVNFLAAFLTRNGDSINQKAVNLHMLEDVLGWLVVLVGAVVMKFTGWTLIDPILSIGVALFILIHSLGHLKEFLDLFLMKIPQGIQIGLLHEQLLALEDVLDVHHIHIGSIDGQRHYATMHIVTNGSPCVVKEQVRQVLLTYHIAHVTLELEVPGEGCGAQVYIPQHQEHHHHH